MNRLLRPILLVAAAATFPAAAQTPPATPPATSPGQAWPANRPPAPPAQPLGQSAAQPQVPAAPQTPANPNAPVPLPSWFSEIDTAKKGEVTRADFLKYRMKTFEQLDTNKDGKLSLEEFIKVAEPPFTTEGPGVPSLEERRSRARAEFQNLDTNRDNFVERAEAEALVHAEFNQYDTDRDNKVTEAEIRRIVQTALMREEQARDQQRREQEAQKRKGLVTINEFIDMQLRGADQLDKNGDGKITAQEYAAVAGPAEGPQAQGLPPFDMRRKVVMVKFNEIDTNKDGVLDRVELTAYAVNQFLQMDLNKDGIVNVPGNTGTGVFAVAIANVGLGGTITASADTGAVTLPLSIQLCQTDPGTGACVSPVGLTVSTQIAAAATAT